jgi:hypothetical protein
MTTTNLSNEHLQKIHDETLVFIESKSFCSDPASASMEIKAGIVADVIGELLALREAAEKPIGWTDAEELRDVEKDGCGYLFTVNPITPHSDPRRVIKLYAAPQLPNAR